MIRAPRREGRLDFLECKINPDELNPDAAISIRSRYPLGEDYAVTPAGRHPYRVRRGNLEFTVCTVKDLPDSSGL